MNKESIKEEIDKYLILKEEEGISPTQRHYYLGIIEGLNHILENTTEIKNKPYIVCSRCEIDNTGKRMCPCPRGGCEAEEVGTITTSIQI